MAHTYRCAIETDEHAILQFGQRLKLYMSILHAKTNMMPFFHEWPHFRALMMQLRTVLSWINAHERRFIVVVIQIVSEGLKREMKYTEHSILL